MMTEDTAIAVLADSNKLLCVDTSKIPLKATKNTQGVQVMTLGKRGSKVCRVSLVSEYSLENPKYYSTRNIPAAGKLLKKEDTQVSLI